MVWATDGLGLLGYVRARCCTFSHPSPLPLLLPFIHTAYPCITLATGLRSQREHRGQRQQRKYTQKAPTYAHKGCTRHQHNVHTTPDKRGVQTWRSSSTQYENSHTKGQVPYLQPQSLRFNDCNVCCVAVVLCIASIPQVYGVHLFDGAVMAEMHWLAPTCTRKLSKPKSSTCHTLLNMQSQTMGDWHCRDGGSAVTMCTRGRV